jgi:hypothetical protein
VAMTFKGHRHHSIKVTGIKVTHRHRSIKVTGIKVTVTAAYRRR